MEDTDRALKQHGESRSARLDYILNTIDGIENKNKEIMLVMTTNNVHDISAPMLRPGRIDDFINMTPPDKETVARLIHYYAQGRIQGDLNRAAEVLAGNIPAVVRECVERSKLFAISEGRPQDSDVVSDDIERAALSMQNQIELLRRATERKAPTPAQELYKSMTGVVTDAVQRLM